MYDDILGKPRPKESRGTLVEKLINEPLNNKPKKALKTILRKKPSVPALIEDEGKEIEDEDDDGCNKCDGGCIDGCDLNEN